MPLLRTLGVVGILSLALTTARAAHGPDLRHCPLGPVARGYANLEGLLGKTEFAAPEAFAKTVSGPITYTAQSAGTGVITVTLSRGGRPLATFTLARSGKRPGEVRLRYRTDSTPDTPEQLAWVISYAENLTRISGGTELRIEPPDFASASALQHDLGYQPADDTVRDVMTQLDTTEMQLEDLPGGPSLDQALGNVETKGRPPKGLAPVQAKGKTHKLDWRTLQKEGLVTLKKDLTLDGKPAADSIYHFLAGPDGTIAPDKILPKDYLAEIAPLGRLEVVVKPTKFTHFRGVAAGTYGDNLRVLLHREGEKEPQQLVNIDIGRAQASGVWYVDNVALTGAESGGTSPLRPGIQKQKGMPYPVFRGLMENLKTMAKANGVKEIRTAGPSDLSVLRLYQRLGMTAASPEAQAELDHIDAMQAKLKSDPAITQALAASENKIKMDGRTIEALLGSVYHDPSDSLRAAWLSYQQSGTIPAGYRVLSDKDGRPTLFAEGPLKPDRMFVIDSRTAPPAPWHWQTRFYAGKLNLTWKLK